MSRLKMCWIFSACLTASFLGLSLEHNTLFEGYDLSLSGYHLCTENKIMNSSKVVSYKTSYSERKPCGGWLPWKMCQQTLYKMAYRTVFVKVTKMTTRCCEGYEQVGSYCALPLSRSAEFTAKPGACPKQRTGDCGLCEWDTDCPDRQKCCRVADHSGCTDVKATGDERGWCLHMTIIVKTDYEKLESLAKGILNHTRLLHAMITGALGSSNCSVYHLNSRPANPYRTASEMLIGSSQALSLQTTTEQLHLLVKRIEEVVSVDVQDMNECAQVELNNCSPRADCVNTVGSYNCSCHPGFTDLSSNIPGIHCNVSHDLRTKTKEELPWPSNSTGTLCDDSNGCPCDSGETYNVTSSSDNRIGPGTWATTKCALNGLQTADLLNVSHVPPTQASLASNRTNTELMPNISSHRVSSTGSLEVTTTYNSTEEENSTMYYDRMELNSTSGPDINDKEAGTSTQWPSDGLKTKVTNSAWSKMAATLRASTSSAPVKTHITMTMQAITVNTSTVPPMAISAVQTLRGNARLTNVQFIEAFRNPSSQEYLNVTKSIEREILASLPPDIQNLVDSGAVKILILGLLPGSVKVDFIVVFTQNVSQGFMNVSQALMRSLQNSSVYSMDNSSSSIEDFNECLASDGYCSPFAHCKNTWGSYTCVCREGFTDTNPQRQGQTCADVNECSAGTSTCHKDAKCENSAGGYTCVCRDGFRDVSQNQTGRDCAAWHTTAAPVPSASLDHTAILSGSATAIPPARVGQTSPKPVISHMGAITVECRASEISVTVAKEFLQNKLIEESSLYLGSPECGVSSRNVSHVQLTVTWDTCGTLIEDNSTHNSAQITLFNNRTLSSPIAPQVYLEIPVVCTYRNNILISTGFSPSGYDMIKDMVAGSGTFHVTLQLLNGTFPLPQNYSLSSNEEVVVEVAINSTLDRIKLVINECWATPTSNPLDSMTSFFLQNSCPVPNTYTTVLQNGNSTVSRLSIRIFSFIQHSVIYLHCKVQICFETSGPTCKPNCNGRTERSKNIIAVTRASIGPIYQSQYWPSQEPAESFHEVIYIIVGVLLGFVLLGAVSLAFYRKRRVGHYNFNFTPKQERITYHVFDT